MPQLSFTVENVEVTPYAATPQLTFRLAVANAERDTAVRNVMLQAQVRIETQRRDYTGDNAEQLFDLFGERERWGRTLKSLLWANTGAAVPAFDGHCTVELPLPCSFDFNVAATQYFHALSGGTVPLTLLFSGSVFYAGAGGALQIRQIPWDTEASFDFPVAVWQAMMDRYYPDSGWLRVPHTVLDQLYRYKRESGVANVEAALARLLDAHNAEAVQ